MIILDIYRDRAFNVLIYVVEMQRDSERSGLEEFYRIAVYDPCDRPVGKLDPQKLGLHAVAGVLRLECCSDNGL